MRVIELKFYSKRKFSPISYWVHKSVEEDLPFDESSEFDPPFPNKDFIKGYPYWTVSVCGFLFEFASIYELRHCIDVLSQKNLPTTKTLAELRGASHGWSNRHWLSRLPGDLKSWSKREKIVKALVKAEPVISE